MTAVQTAIIGGTGIYDLEGIGDLKPIEVETEYGSASVNVGELHAKRVAFLTRHGRDHGLAPGRINYRANIAALKKLGVRQVFATACSGSINPKYGVGDLVLLDQFLEFTKNRKETFLDGTGGKLVGHVDNTEPYCKRLGEYVGKAGKALGQTIKDGAVYCCMEGPRFESGAEIKLLQKMGGDLVGQTNYPEVVLAREAEFCYCAVGIVSNLGAGIGESAITATEVAEIMKKKMSQIGSILAKAVDLLEENRDCACHHLLDRAFL